MKHDALGRSFNELNAMGELLKIQQLSEMTAEIADKIATLKKEIRFEKLMRARREYEASNMPPEQWPKSLQGRTFCEWEIVHQEGIRDGDSCPFEGCL